MRRSDEFSRGASRGGVWSVGSPRMTWSSMISLQSHKEHIIEKNLTGD